MFCGAGGRVLVDLQPHRAAERYDATDRATPVQAWNQTDVGGALLGSAITVLHGMSM